MLSTDDRNELLECLGTELTDGAIEEAQNSDDESMSDLEADVREGSNSPQKPVTMESELRHAKTLKRHTLP